MKRRKLCKIANKKVSDQDQQVNPPTTSTEIISKPTILVPDVEIRDIISLASGWKIMEGILRMEKIKKNNSWRKETSLHNQKERFFSKSLKKTYGY